MVLLLHLASAPGGLSGCAPGAVSVAGKDTVLCLSVCPAMLGVQGLVGLCWQCPGYEPGMGRGAQQLLQELLCKEQIHMHKTWLWHSPGLPFPAQAEVNLFLAGLEAGEAEQRV